MAFKLALDAGHGGTDPGAGGYGLHEKDLTLAIVMNIKAIMEKEYEDVDILLTRHDDTFVGLSERARLANDWGADYFLAIHINASGATGFESYIWNGGVSAATVAYQNIIHEEVYRTAYAGLGFPDRGKQQADFAVVRETKMPAILTENLFIDNPKDAAALKNPNFLEKIARGHVNGLAKAFGLKARERVTIASAPVEQPFSDVPSDHWAATDIAWCKAQGLMVGYDGRFNPDGALTRAEMAAILKRLRE